MFTVVPVDGYEELNDALRARQDYTSSIVLINCAVTCPILEILNVPPNSTVFVVDSRRPLNHFNVFEANQIRILVNEAERSSLGIPNLDDVIAKDEDSESDDDDDEYSEGSNDGGGRRNIIDRVTRRAVRKENKRLWESQKNKILWQYYEYNWHSTSTAVQMLELAAELDRASAELMWYAAIGVSSQYTDRLIPIEGYTDTCVTRMKPFITKFSPKNAAKSDDLLRISFGKELPLALYTHWNLYNAMAVNEYFACKTKNWTQKGEKNMKELLAKMGITLVETSRKFESIESKQKKELIEILDKEMGIGFASFTVHLGYSGQVNAADIARAAALRIESPHNVEPMDRFQAALRIIRAAISGPKDQQVILVDAFERSYQKMLKMIWHLVGTAINQSEIVSTGAFYLMSSQRAISAEVAESRHFLLNFTHFLLKAFACSKRGRSGKPLIVTFPLPQSEKQPDGWHVVTGIMPLATAFEDNTFKSIIGRAFERAAKDQQNMQLSFDSFDNSIITMRATDRARFFDKLQSILETSGI
ncbi:hypothetical protein WR25_16955 isoform C [Diploscapter pachys]|nr:hypothetical protein WR25_16955 isoform C [Diploscapter pachys]